jgi:PAS domain S-box-containing protein
MNYLYLLHFIAYFTAGGVILSSRYEKSSVVERIRYKYFLAGIILTCIVGATFNVILPIAFHVGYFIYFGPLGSIFVVISTAYAILKYRLMDVSLVIKKTSAYSLVTTGITFSYVLVVMAFEFIFRSILGYSSFWAAVPAALVVALTFIPVREQLQRVTDRIFFRHIVLYQRVIKEITRTIVSVTDLHTIFRLIDRTIVRVMCIKNASVLLLEEKENQYVVEKTNGLPQVITGIRLSLDDPLVTYLIEKKDAIILEEIKALLASDLTPPAEKEKLKKIQAEMEHFEAAVSVPSFLRNRLVGILNLGEKLSGELYSPDDLELLFTLTSEAAVAIENAKLYRDISQTRDYLNNLVQGSDDAILTLDLSGTVLTLNRGAEELFGVELAEAAGKIPPFFSADEIKDMLGQVVSGQPIKALEIRKTMKKGVEYSLLLTLSAICEGDGKIIGFSAIIKDITRLRRLDIVKQEFLYTISNELRTPLTPIHGYLSLLLSGELGELTPKQKETLEIVLKQGQRLQNLIDSVIDISRIEAGKPLGIKREPVFLDEIVRENIENYRSAYQSKGIKLEAVFPANRIALMADQNKLLRVMENLLGNAYKYTPVGGEVRVLVTEEGGQARVSVVDTGIGLAPQHLANVFQKFYQIDNGYARSSGGIGMGLAIAREIVETHGGRIWAESQGIGRGSSFIFTLPVGAA